MEIIRGECYAPKDPYPRQIYLSGGLSVLPLCDLRLLGGFYRFGYALSHCAVHYGLWCVAAVDPQDLCVQPPRRRHVDVPDVDAARESPDVRTALLGK